MNENDVYENQLEGAEWAEAKYIRGIDAEGGSVLLPAQGMGYETATIEEINNLFEN